MTSYLLKTGVDLTPEKITHALQAQVSRIQAKLTGPARTPLGRRRKSPNRPERDGHEDDLFVKMRYVEDEERSDRGSKRLRS